MNNYHRLSIAFVLSSLILGSIGISLLFFTPVRADVGVQPVLPGGSSIKPVEETPIQMATEIVIMNVRPATEADNALITLAPRTYGLQFSPVWFPGIAEVEAEFTMMNPTSKMVSMTVWFPLASALENADWNLNPGEIVPRIESFQVNVDGTPVDHTVSELPNPKGEGNPPLPWANFPVTFPGGTETTIHVSYLLPLQPSIKGNEMILYYIFKTGAGWDGPIGRAELILNLPYPASVGTMAGIKSGRLYLPYFSTTKESTSLPSDVVLEGNQARWTWEDLEPGPEDDIAIWLLQPGKWQELETALAVVRANSQDGRAWLDLASTYHSLSTTDRLRPLIFSPSYLSAGIEAYQKAIELLPEHPGPHAGLALLTLAPYMEEKNAPPDLIQSVQDEYQIASELEAKNPTLANETGISHWLLTWLEEALDTYFYNDATATVDAATRAVWEATETYRATLDYATSTLEAITKATFMACWATASDNWEECYITPSPTKTLAPKPTHTPLPTFSPTSYSTLTSEPEPKILLSPMVNTGNGKQSIIVVAAGITSLVIISYLVFSRRQGG